MKILTYFLCFSGDLDYFQTDLYAAGKRQLRLEKSRDTESGKDPAEIQADSKRLWLFRDTIKHSCTPPN